MQRSWEISINGAASQCASPGRLYFVIIARLQRPEAKPLVARRERSSTNPVRSLF